MHCPRIEHRANDALKAKYKQLVEKLKIEKQQTEVSRGRKINQDTKRFQQTGSIEDRANETEKAKNGTKHKDAKKLAKGNKDKAKVAKGHMTDKMEESDLGGEGKDTLQPKHPPRTAPGRIDESIISIFYFGRSGRAINLDLSCLMQDQILMAQVFFPPWAKLQRLPQMQ